MCQFGLATTQGVVPTVGTCRLDAGRGWGNLHAKFGLAIDKRHWCGRGDRRWPVFDRERIRKRGSVLGNPREKSGFHIFRRFRASWLRKNRVPWDLEKMWMGHAHKDFTDQYAEQLLEDVKYRREWCEKIGLGFDLPTNLSQPSQLKLSAVASGKAA